MAVEMLGVRMEPSSFRWFNSVYHRWADRGQGAGIRTWGLAGSKTQLRGGQASREPVCWAAQVASQWSRATRATLGLMASSSQEVQEAAEGDGGGEVGGEGGNVGEGGRGESGLVEGGGTSAPVDEGAHAGGVGEPRGIVVGGEEGDLVLGELLGEGEPPEEGAGFDGGAGKGDGEDVHICRHVARRGQQAWGLLGVQGDGQEGPGVGRRQLFALEVGGQS